MQSIARYFLLLIAALGLSPLTSSQAAKPTPPPGICAIFNGRDLTGWYGLNPHSVVKVTGEARQFLGAAEAEKKAALARALTLHASFDKGLEADFSRGDKTCYVLQGKDLVTAAPTDEVRLAPDAGRFGGGAALHEEEQLPPGVQGRGRARLQRQELERDRSPSGCA